LFPADVVPEADAVTIANNPFVPELFDSVPQRANTVFPGVNEFVPISASHQPYELAVPPRLFIGKNPKLNGPVVFMVAIIGGDTVAATVTPVFT
jgi:hypothetical protein